MNKINYSQQVDQHQNEAPTEYISIDDGPRPMSFKIVEALEDGTELDLSSAPSLGYVVDLEAIDKLYATACENSRTPPVVSFQYRGYQITIENAQEIRVVSD
jgi:hypothetical protein